MERAAAIKKLTKLLGKKLGWRINPKAPTTDERQAAREAIPAAIAERNRLKELCDTRHRQLLADPEYQRLNSERKAAADNVEKLSSITRHYKITVGTSEEIFFLIKAEGDSWEEIISKLTAKNEG